MKFKILLLCCLFLVPQSLMAASTPDLTKYLNFVNVNPVRVEVPTTVRAVIPASYLNFSGFDGNPLVVQEIETGEISKILSLKSLETKFVPDYAGGIDFTALFDDRGNTSVRFDGSSAVISLTTVESVRVQNISLLNSFSGFSEGFNLELEVLANDKVVLNRTKIKNFNDINLSSIFADNLTLKFWYNQPFDLSEITFGIQGQTQADEVFWTAKPNMTYKIYVGLAGNTQDGYYYFSDYTENLDFENAGLSSIFANPSFVDPDDDKDSILNTKDNCVFGANPLQEDVNKNQIGDACEDFDKDSLAGYRDNCPADNNPDQVDTDGDGNGDVCDNYENRVTERLPYLPWVVIGIVGLLMGYIIVTNVRKVK